MKTKLQYLQYENTTEPTIGRGFTLSGEQTTTNAFCKTVERTPEELLAVARKSTLNYSKMILDSELISKNEN